MDDMLKLMGKQRERPSRTRPICSLTASISQAGSPRDFMRAAMSLSEISTQSIVRSKIAQNPDLGPGGERLGTC